MATRRFDELYPQGGAATARGVAGVSTYGDPQRVGRPMPDPGYNAQLQGQPLQGQQHPGEHRYPQQAHAQHAHAQHAHAQPAQFDGQHSEGQQWLVLINPAMRRMMSTREVQAEVRAGTLPRETLAWRAGMSEWAALGAIQELGLPNRNPTLRTTPALGWDAPLAPTAAEPQGPARQHPEFSAAPRAAATNPQLGSELVSAGAAALVIVAVTTYLLSLGGAFQAGSAHPARSQGAVPSAPHAH